MQGNSHQDMLETAAWTKLGARPPIPQGMPAPLEKLLRDCWKQDPVERPSFEEIVQRFLVRPRAVRLRVIAFALVADCFMLQAAPT